jgi:hypothetical protein
VTWAEDSPLDEAALGGEAKEEWESRDEQTHSSVDQDRSEFYSTSATKKEEKCLDVSEETARASHDSAHLSASLATPTKSDRCSRSPSKCTLNYGRVTTTQLTALSTQPKEGHLMKKSTSFFSSRWNRKYFVLNGLRLQCFDKSEHYFYGSRKPKTMTLSLSTCTSFTDDANTFVVKTTDEADHTLTWTLAAPNHTEKNEWVRSSIFH